MIEVYAIAERRPAPLPDPGLHAFAVGGLDVVWAASPDDEATPEALWRREQLVEALMEDRTVLPVRYGTRFADEDAAAAAIAPRELELAAALERVRGRVELSVRAAGGAPDDVVATVHEPLAALARDSVLGEPREGERLRAAYLVDRAAVPQCVELVGALERRHSDLALLCTGPWPPYSFTAP